METEQVEILNDQFEPIGVETKLKAHQLGLLHRCVVAELIDSQGNWILVQQAADKQDALRFVSPVGGHQTAGESIDRAMIREAEEELGIKPISYKFIGELVFNREVIGRRENHLFCIYEIYSDELPQLNHESVGWRKFSRAELADQLINNPQIFGEAFLFLVEKMYPQLKRI